MKNSSSPGSSAFFKAVCAWVLLGLIAAPSLRAQTPLTNANFNTARDLWFSDQASAIATYGHIKDWNVTGVTNMTEAFKNKTTFDENITGWDVSNVTNMQSMFYNANAFNQPIGDWNTSAVTNMIAVFNRATDFNQSIGDWNTSSVTMMNDMFFMANAFDQPIGNWGTSSVTLMPGMFYQASSFNQDLSDWNLSAATGMGGMFNDANALSNAHKGLIHTSFSSNSNWPYSSWSAHVFIPPPLTDANFTTAVNLWFSDEANATATYGHIRDWNVTGVTNMANAFKDRSTFNEDISGWNVSSVTNMYRIFHYASSFNQPIGDWNTSAVTSMGDAFSSALSFDQDISGWNTSAVWSMGGMFVGAQSFDQDISDWNVSAVTSMHIMFYNAYALSEVNKGLIHGSFSKNSNWTTDWSVHHTRPAHVVPSAANLRMLWVQPGSFIMGSPVTETGRQSDREDEHNVTLTKGFYLGKYEVTQAQYEAVMTGNSNGLSPTPSQWPNNPNRPVEKVSWDDVQVFLSRLNAAEAANLPAGWTYALPTESEWEYACRAGTTTVYSWGNDSNATRANYDASGIGQTGDVGQYAPNPWGFYDMHGNVWEWINDRYQAAYPTGTVIDPTGPGSGSNRVHRGGAWYFDDTYLRSAGRPDGSAGYRNATVGFRLAFRQTSPPPPITDANFTTAVNLWFSDEANATATYGHISNWDVSAVTDMQEAFKDRATFNQDIGDWDTSAVTNMVGMFSGATSFNQDISDWNTSSVMDMSFLFRNALSFNQAIGNWNTSAVTGMIDMFYGTASFNQNIGDWDTSAVTNMRYMFYNTMSFNQDIGDWNTSSVTDMQHMFRSATAFNQDISDWNVSSVTNMSIMFQNTPALSNANKGLIHSSFSSNSNWTYDWSAHIAAPPPDDNGTNPPIDENSTDPPTDHNGTSPPPENNQTQPDQNATAPPPGDPVVTLYRPLPKTLAREELANGNFRLWGMVLADGGSPVTQVAFEVADNLVFRNSTLHTATMLAGSPNFSTTLTLEPGKRYYYRAVATNAMGTTSGSPKKLITPPSQSRWWTNAPEISGGWRNSPWLGAFRPYDNGWIYHAKLGWAYAHPDGSGGLWLWFRDHHWMWTRQGVFPYLWKHDLGTWHYLLGTRNGQPVFYEWTESAPLTQP